MIPENRHFTWQDQRVGQALYFNPVSWIARLGIHSFRVEAEVLRRALSASYYAIDAGLAEANT